MYRFIEIVLPFYIWFANKRNSISLVKLKYLISIDCMPSRFQSTQPLGSGTHERHDNVKIIFVRAVSLHSRAFNCC